MTTKKKVHVLICYYVVVLFVSHQVQISAESLITLVTRDDTDSFRVGQEGCKNNVSICTSVKASCQDDGLCKCQQNYPNFRNPVITTKSTSTTSFETIYGNSYGCNKDDEIRVTLGASVLACNFKPFQLLPADSNATVIFKDQKSSYNGCLLSSLLASHVKYPNNNTLMKLDWLNGTYVEINVKGNQLFFKWRKSVPELQGLIVKIRMYCVKTDGDSAAQCFEGKVSGTWKHPGVQVSSTTQPPPTTDTFFNIKTTMVVPTSTFIPTHSGPSVSTSHSTINQTTMSIITTPSSQEEKYDIVIIAAAAGGGVLLILLIVVCCCLLRRRKRCRKSTSEANNEQGIPNPEYCGTLDTQDEHDNLYDSANTPKQNEIKHENKNGVMYAISNKKMGSEKLDKVKSGHEMDERLYDKPEVNEPKKEIEREEVNGVMYAVSDKMKKSQEKDKTRNKEKKDKGEDDKAKIKKPNEIEREEMNGVMHAVSDKKKKSQKEKEVKEDESEMTEVMYAEPEVKEAREIKRKEVNGVMYAVSDKMKKQGEESEKMQKDDRNAQPEESERVSLDEENESSKEKEIDLPESVDMDDVNFEPPPNYNAYELEEERNQDGYERVKDILNDAS